MTIARDSIFKVIGSGKVSQGTNVERVRIAMIKTFIQDHGEILQWKFCIRHCQMITTFELFVTSHLIPSFNLQEIKTRLRPVKARAEETKS